jgi:energy-coupling factor transporter transmembrane protein EcfT
LIYISFLSFFNSFIVYPILNISHTVLIIIPAIVTCVYFSNKYIKIKISNRNAVILYVFIIVLIIISVSLNYLKNNYISDNTYIKSNLKYFKGSYIDKKDEEMINEVSNYILNKYNEKYNVYILEDTAAAININCDKFNNIYDMFLTGNIGTKSADYYLNELKKENTIVLIYSSDKDSFWQTPDNTHDFIKNNFILIDKCNKFDVYEFKKINR